MIKKSKDKVAESTLHESRLLAFSRCLINDVSGQFAAALVD